MFSIVNVYPIGTCEIPTILYNVIVLSDMSSSVTNVSLTSRPQRLQPSIPRNDSNIFQEHEPATVTYLAGFNSEPLFETDRSSKELKS